MPRKDIKCTQTPRRHFIGFRTPPYCLGGVFTGVLLDIGNVRFILFCSGPDQSFYVGSTRLVVESDGIQLHPISG